MRSSLLLLFALETCVSGQVRSQIIGSAYTLPGPFFDAPGQLVTLIVQSLDSSITKIVRAPGGTDLPTSLAGISATLTQLTRPTGIYSQHAPILEVRPYSPCNSDLIFECVNLLAITVQIPFDAPLGLSQSPSDTDISGTVGIAGSGDSGDNCCGYGKVLVGTLPDQVHILTGCDTFISTTIPLSQGPGGLSCPSIVTHPDGSPVSVNNPAKAGEELVAYAVGLGQTNPPSITGQLVTTAAPTQTTFTLDFNYRPNALPSRPLPSGPKSIFSGTTPGFVGLYQINFVVPPAPAGTPACVDASTLPYGSNVVQSNLTVSVGGLFSFDGARICVDVSNP